MAEAAAREPSMEEILASIRKIISQDEGQPQAGGPATATQSPRLPAEPLGFDHLPQPARAAPSPQQAYAQPTRTSSEPAGIDTVPMHSRALQPGAPRNGPTLASLTDEVRRQMPRTSAAPQPMPRPQAPDPSAAADIRPTPKPFYPTKAHQLSEPERPVAAPDPRSPRPQQSLASLAVSPMAPKPAAAVPAQPAASRQPVAPSREPLVSPATGHAVAQSVERLKAAVADDTSAKVEMVLRPMLREWLDKHLPAMVERIVREEIERIARS